MSDTVASIGAPPCEAPPSRILIRDLVATYPDPMTILAPLQPGALSAGVVLAMVSLVWQTFGVTSPVLLLLAQALIAIGFALFALLVTATMRLGDQR